MPHLLIILILTLTLGTISLTNITTTKEYPTASTADNVLGEDNKTEDQKKSEEQAKEAAKKSEEQRKEAAKSLNSGSSNNSGSPDTKTKTETVINTGVKSKIQTEGKKSETEIETPDGQKIKTKIEDDGTTKVEIEHGQLKLKYVVENGVFRLKAENESGQEVELKHDEQDKLEQEIENKLDDDGVKIATNSGKPIIIRNNIAAQTNFPLSIDVGTNQLIVTTPNGQKIVTILPDQAVQNLLATNVINKVEKSTDTNLTNELGNLSGVIKLELRGSEVVYRIKGTKNKRLLGLIPVDTQTTNFVSTQTGSVVAKEDPLLTTLINFLSP